MNKYKQLINRYGYQVCALFCVVLTTVLSSILFYRYIFVMNSSDFPAHIQMAMAGKGYSINFILMPLFYRLTNSYLGIVILMAVFIFMTIVAVVAFMKMLCKLTDQDFHFYRFVPVACAMLFICKICIPEWSPFFYKGSFTTQPWHNSTYIEMRCFAILTLMMYFKIRKDYLDKISIRDCILFTLFLTVTNFAKPNFIISFAPIMLIMLIHDFIKTRGRSFKNAFIFGACVLISCGTLSYQYSVLFPSEGNAKIIISLAHAADYVLSDHKFVLYLILNYLFVVYVAVLFIKNRKQMSLFDRQLYIETWGMNILSFLTMLFVMETGKRALHGNFEWGCPFFAFVLFVISWILLKKMRKQQLISERQQTIAECMFACHIVYGVFYFLTLFIGYVSWIL